MILRFALAIGGFLIVVLPRIGALASALFGAAAIAVALGAAKLVLLTDVAGLYASWPGTGGGSDPAADRPGEVISQLGAAELEAMLPGLSDGMIPKMEACLTAVRGGVPQAHVLDGRLPHAILLEIFTDSGIGTMVVPDGAGP